MDKMEFRTVIQPGSYAVIELNCLELSSKNQFFLFIITDFADTPFSMIDFFFHDK